MLVGRDQEAQEVLCFLEDPTLLPGQLRLIQLDGPLGIGKSSLLTSVLSQTSIRSLLIHGDRLYSDGPLSSFRTLIESLFEDSLENLLKDRSPPVLAQHFVQSLGDDPVVLAVDDAQWLDRASEDFLIHVIRTPSQAPLTLLLVHRSQQIPKKIFAAARRRGALHEHVTLQKLNESAIQQIIGDLTPTQIEAVQEVAQGNPLYARAISAGFKRHPEYVRVQDIFNVPDGEHLPGLEVAIIDDIVALPQDARRTLETLAIVGDPDQKDLIQQISGLADVSYQQSISELKRRGLLGSSYHDSLHPVVRFSVYRQADPIWRDKAHRKAAAFYAAESLKRADHLARIKSSVDNQESQDLITAAALAIGTEPQTAIRWLNKIPQEYRSNESEVLLARAELLNGHVKKAIKRLRTLIRKEPSPESTIVLANALRIAGELEEARATLTAPSYHLDAGLLRELIDVLNLIEGHTPDHLIAQLASLPGEKNQVTAAIYRTMEILFRGEVAQARRLFMPALEWLLKAADEDIATLLHAVACAAWCCYMLDEYADGTELASRALKIAKRFGQADTFANLGAAQAYCLVQLARLPEGEEAAQQAIADAQRYGSADVIPMATAALVIAGQAQRDPAVLRTRYEELKSLHLPEFGWWRRAVLTTLTRASALLGEPELALELLAEPKDAMVSLRFADAALVAARTQQIGLAHSLVQEGLEIAEQQESWGQHAMLLTTKAELMLELGEFKESKKLLGQARQTFEERGMALQLGRVHAALARIEQQSAEAEDPLEVLTKRERQIAEEIGAGLTNREIAELFTISQRTVENHTSNIMRKLGVSSRVGVISLVQSGTTRLR